MSLRHRVCAWAGALAIISAACGAAAAATPAPPPVSARLVVHGDRPGARIDPNIYGQFAEHLGGGVYGGVWVGEDSPIANIHGYRTDVVEALKAIHVPVVRWPGGCFADEYHWRDGIGPRSRRPVRLNKIWGGVEETNAFGTHEYMNFAELIGAKTYVAAAVGAGSPAEMSQWVDYLTSDSHAALAEERRANGRDKAWKVDFLGVGNETWGCGGNMRPEFYADLYRQYATFIRTSPDKPVVRVASGANGDDVKWTEALMSSAVDLMDAYSIHYYTIPTGVWAHKGSATSFDEAAWISTLNQALRMDRIIADHSAVMDRYDPKKRVALFVDEWGTWTDAEPGTNPAFLYQQNSLREAITAAVNLDIFHAHADRVRMANIAQMVNVLQAMMLTDGPRMVKTPTYHVFDMYQVFQGADDLPIELQTPDYRLGEVSVPGVHATAARDAAGVTHIGLVNLNPNLPAVVSAELVGLAAKRVSGRVLTGPAMTSINTFDAPFTVKPAAFAGARLKGPALTVTLPPRSVVVLDLK